MDTETQERVNDLRLSYATGRYKPKPLDGSKPLWRKQKGESSQAYEAFMTYLMLPAETRTAKNAAEALGKTMSLLLKWSCQWSWVYRVGAYEEHYLLIRLESVEADKDAMWRQQKTIADTGLEVVSAGLAYLISEINENGGLDKIKGDTLVRLLDTAAKIQRMAVLGRSQLFDEVKERRQTLHEEWSDELAQTFVDFMNRMSLNQEQQEQAKVVLEELLVGRDGP